MKNQFLNTVVYLTALVLMACPATNVFAHDGRRLDIQVIDNQLVTQGYLKNPTPVSNDGGGVVRPYFNVIHDHFTNVGGSGIASLPGFDITNPMPLLGSDVTLELLNASKWTPPPRVGTGPDQDFGTPVLTDLDAGETLSIGFLGSGQSSIDSNTLGSFTLASNIDAATANADIDLNYIFNQEAVGSIYALKWQLSTTQAGIADSDSVYTLFAPDGSGPDERLHFQSLALEEFLGVRTAAVPEPGSWVLLTMLAMPIALRRKR